MPNKKITAMPSLAGNQVPTDLVTAVDLSAAPVNQNVKSTLNDLFATITKNITDRAIRFQAPGSAPAVAAASQGALYHNGSAFLASSNGGAYEPVYTLSAQSAAVVFAGPTSGPAATPTFRALALTDLPSLATASLLGRISAGTGSPEQITSKAAVLTWLQNPTSNNLSAAVTDATGAGGAAVFAFGPTLKAPRFNAIDADPSGSGTNILFSPTAGAVNYLEVLNAVSGSGPTLRPTGLQANQPLNLSSRGTGIVSVTGNLLRVTGNTAAAAGILELRGGNISFSGGQIRLYETTTFGTSYIGFQAPDSLASVLLFELPATDGTAGQCLTTDGAGILSWATRGTGTVTSVGLSAPSIFTVANSPVTGSDTLALSLATQSAALVFAGPTSGGAATPTFRSLALTDLPSLATASLLGRISAGTGTPEQITSTAAVLTWLQNPTSSNLAAAMTDETGSGALVFGTSPTIATPSFTGQASFAIGTVTAPSITWSGDLNTGCYSPAADTVAVTTGGVERMRVSAAGNVGINTTNPSSLLHLGGTTNKTIRLDTALGNTGWYAAWQDGCITSVNRNPLDGSFIDSNKTAAFIILQGQSNDGYISFSTSNLNGVFPPERMRIDSGGRVGIGTSTPATSAQLEIASTTGALLLPRLTTAERDALTAINGMIIYNSTLNQIQGRVNGAWTNL